MKDAGASELRRTLAGIGELSWAGRLRDAAAGFWLGVFFFLTQRAPWIARAMKRPLVWLAIRFSPSIRKGTAANGRRILPPEVSQKELSDLTRSVVASFYDFVCDVGQSLRMTREDLAGKIEAVEGHDKYQSARAAKRGAIILTAHIGSFEVGMAALLEFEKRIHVVFKRDVGRFERTRQAMRKRLGVVEQAVDDGWEMWMRLRDALAADEVVAIQGDRVMPGQKGVRTPFLFGHMLLPSGPVKLAIASGAPIIPVFSIRSGGGKVRLFIEDAINAGEDSDQATKQIAAVLAKYVASYKEQWLMLHPAFCEDCEVKAEVSS